MDQGSVCSWKQKSVCGQVKSQYMVCFRGQSVTRAEVSLYLDQDSIHPFTSRVKDQMGQGQGSDMATADGVCGIKAATELHLAKVRPQSQTGL